LKLLFLTPQLPYPPHQGTTIRNFNILKHLAPRHHITLLSFGTEQELPEADPLRALCREIHVVPYPTRTLAQRALTTFASPLPDMALRLGSLQMQERFDALVRQHAFDLIQVEGIEMAPFIEQSKILARDSKILFDDHNAEYALQRTAFQSDLSRPRRWHAALYSLIQWKKLERHERAICERAAVVVTCSHADDAAIRALFDSENPHLKFGIIPNGVDLDHYVPSDEVCAKPLAELSLVFTGKMDFRPNIDAMLWFCDDILPRLRAQVPLAHIAIVGQKPAQKILARQSPGAVEVTGWVSDVRPYIADAAVYVVPLRMGSGTRLKVLEAMGMGKAIVSTTRGVAGIDVTDGRDVVIADSPEDFAAACIALLRDPDRRRELGRAARQIAEEKYDWRILIPRFDEIYSEIGI
jgi:sugar transferase (PEP-CTERM/EpsH1 system associated)